MASRAPQTCSNCDSTEIDHDPARGDSVCLACGAVLEENVVVAEVGFAEDARGRSSVVGQHVNASGRPNSFSVLPGFSREATAITMSNGRRRIWHLVSAMRLTPRHAESALRLFRLAVERNFHKGRRMVNVCCACLYVVVRIERTPHMLIDFSDVVETNVYVLGNTFLKFAQILNIELPIIDPSLYIHRFASKLEFGDKTQAVAMSALRLLARMRREWMSHGRRPNGLCGAALIIAARMHNFYRSQQDVVQVVRIGNVALRERLNEVALTATANMTADEINAGGGDDGKVASLNVDDAAEPCDPPAFRRAVLEAKAVEAAKAKSAEQGAAGGSSPNMSNSADRPAGEGQVSSEGDAGRSGEGSGGDPSEVMTDCTVGIGSNEARRTAQDIALEKEFAETMKDREIQELELETREGEAVASGHRSNSISGALDQSIEGGGTIFGRTGMPAAAAPSAAMTAASAAAAKAAAELKMDEELSDLDDDDEAIYLNTDEEFKVKEAVWTEMNKDYLEKQARLEKLKRDNPEEYKRQKPSKGSKKRRTAGEKTGESPAKSPAETAPRPPPRPTSRKLNYSVLRSLSSVHTGDSAVGPSAARPPLPNR